MKTKKHRKNKHDKLCRAYFDLYYYAVCRGINQQCQDMDRHETQMTANIALKIWGQFAGMREDVAVACGRMAVIAESVSVG